MEVILLLTFVILLNFVAFTLVMVKSQSVQKYKMMPQKRNLYVFSVIETNRIRAFLFHCKDGMEAARLSSMGVIIAETEKLGKRILE